MNICKNCGKVYTDKKFDIAVCSRKCKIEYQRIKRIEKSKEKFADKPHCECRICGFRAQSLATHIKLVHNITIDKYREIFNLSLDDVILPSVRESNAEKQRQNIKEGKHCCFTSENNPSKGKACKEGRNSPFSMNFRGYDGLSDTEKKEKIKLITDKSQKSMNERCNNPLRIEYYIKRGMSKEEAFEALKKRQSTFSKEKCITKYGEDIGLKKWSKRQEMWQKHYKHSNFSKISQEVFWKIYNKLNTQHQREVYFATIDLNRNEDWSKNHEYTLNIGNKTIKPDFYIPSLKLIIEFDGDYWHNYSEERRRKDIEKEKILKENNYLIYNIVENEYNKNPDKVIEEVLNFIYKG